MRFSLQRNDPRYFMIEAARSGIRLSPRRHSGVGPAPPRVTDCHLSVTFLVYAKRSAIKQRREEYGPPRLEKGSCPRAPLLVMTEGLLDASS